MGTQGVLSKERFLIKCLIVNDKCVNPFALGLAPKEREESQGKYPTQVAGQPSVSQ